MGVFSGDNIAGITVGRRVTATTRISACDTAGGHEIDTITPGTDLGICNNAQDNSIFVFGSWWLSFPAPSDPIGDNGDVTGAFWIKYDPSTINVDGAVPQDNSGLNGLPQGLQNIFGMVWNMVLVLIVIAVIFAGVLIFLNYKKK